jgi:hypothetical protein
MSKSHVRDSLFHLNACSRIIGDYTKRHNFLVDQLSVTIKFNCSVMNTLNENTTILLTTRKARMDNHVELESDQTKD